MADHLLGNDVHQVEELCSRCLIISKIDGAWMNCLIADYTDDIERLLNKRVEPFLD
jgi:hypothetical protein